MTHASASTTYDPLQVALENKIRSSLFRQAVNIRRHYSNSKARNNTLLQHEHRTSLLADFTIYAIARPGVFRTAWKILPLRRNIAILTRSSLTNVWTEISELYIVTNESLLETASGKKNSCKGHLEPF